MTTGTTEYKIARYENLAVYYRNAHRAEITRAEDRFVGGGEDFGQDYPRLVPMLRRRPRTVFEWLIQGCCKAAYANTLAGRARRTVREKT